MKLDIDVIKKAAGIAIVEDGSWEGVKFSKKKSGQFGDMIIITNPALAKIFAETLGVEDGWKLTTLNKGFAAYNSGDRLTIMSDKKDYEEEN